MDSKFYIYRFLDEDDSILYIGRTNDIYRRILKEHFTSLGHLPFKCYQSIEKVQYAEFENESEEVAYEAILINKLKPKYNIQFKDEGYFNVKLPNIEWKDFVFPYDYYLDYLKNRKINTQHIKDFIINKIHYDSIDTTLLKTGFNTFDKVTPISNTDFILVAGETAKTAYALNICSNMAIFQNKKVLYVNLKEDGEILAEKLIAMNSHLTLEKVRKNLFTEDEVKKYAAIVNMLSQTEIQFTNLSYENKTIDNIIDTIKTDSYDFIIIDDLQSIVNDKDIYIKDKTIEVMQKLKNLTTDIKTPLLLLSSIPLDKISSRQDHRPIISDFEYDSMRSFPDIIKFIYRDDYYDFETTKRNIIEVIVSKSRLNHSFAFELVILDSYNNIVNIE